MGACISKQTLRALQPGRMERRIQPAEDRRKVNNLKPSTVTTKPQPSNDYGF